MTASWTFVSSLCLCGALACVSRAAGAAPLPGGFSETAVTNAGVVAAADFAVKTQALAGESQADLALLAVLDAHQQVVAGTKYRLHLRLKVDGALREAEAVVWRKLSGEHALISWTWQ